MGDWHGFRNFRAISTTSGKIVHHNQRNVLLPISHTIIRISFRLVLRRWTNLVSRFFRHAAHQTNKKSFCSWNSLFDPIFNPSNIQEFHSFLLLFLARLDMETIAARKAAAPWGQWLAATSNEAAVLTSAGVSGNSAEAVNDNRGALNLAALSMPISCYLVLNSKHSK